MVVVGDFIVCAQNNFSPEPETGRHDGGTGLVLRRTPEGLEAVPPHIHGITMFGDCRNLLALPDSTPTTILFGMQNAKPQTYHRTGTN
jgi:hypothetical protein